MVKELFIAYRLQVQMKIMENIMQKANEKKEDQNGDE